MNILNECPKKELQCLKQAYLVVTEFFLRHSVYACVSVCMCVCVCVCVCVWGGFAVHFCVLNFIIELTLKALSWHASFGKCLNMCDEFPYIFLKPNHN